jgi:chorismate mutase / prephenate dehydratase
MSLDELRQKIDDVDARIVSLIADRMRLAEEIGQEKKVSKKFIEDRQRELKVIQHVRDVARNQDISQRDVEKIYQLIIDASKKVQGVAVAFQGEPGAYSEEAATRFFGPQTQGRPRETLEQVFRAVETEEVPFGVVPVENSTEGSINRVYDLLLDSSLMVCGEVELRISHHLIANPGVTMDSIKKVYSHPQALAQCRAFLLRLHCEAVSTYDTAGSVKMIKEQGLKDCAAIASARAAEIYGMQILASGIEDNPNNYTRFFVLSKEDAPVSGNDKTSIVFSLKHNPGVLFEALKEFASRNINLTKLESRPTRQAPWEYNFYLDFSGHRQDKEAQEALEKLRDTSIFVKVLGSYPKAR